MTKLEKGLWCCICDTDFDCNTNKCRCKKFTWTAKFKIIERRVRDEEIICMGNELLECLTVEKERAT